MYKRQVYLVFAAGPSFAVFSAAGICFYKIQKSGSYSVLDLDGLFCRTSVFYGSSRDGSKREHPVHCRNAPPVFMLYSSVSDRGVVCVLLPAYAVEYTCLLYTSIASSNEPAGHTGKNSGKD